MPTLPDEQFPAFSQYLLSLFVHRKILVYETVVWSDRCHLFSHLTLDKHKHQLVGFSLPAELQTGARRKPQLSSSASPLFLVCVQKTAKLSCCSWNYALQQLTATRQHVGNWVFLAVYSFKWHKSSSLKFNGLLHIQLSLRKYMHSSMMTCLAFLAIQGQFSCSFFQKWQNTKVSKSSCSLSIWK